MSASITRQVHVRTAASTPLVRSNASVLMDCFTWLIGNLAWDLSCLPILTTSTDINSFHRTATDEENRLKVVGPNEDVFTRTELGLESQQLDLNPAAGLALCLKMNYFYLN